MAATDDSKNSMAGTTASNSGGKQTGPTAEQNLSIGSLVGFSVRQVAAGFQRLRQEQRSMATKAAELEMEINVHGLAIDALREADPTRKCYRLIGGVLVERTVQEVLPALESNKEQISEIVESLSTQMQTKGQELNEYREHFNIRIVGEQEAPNKATASEGSEGVGTKGGTGVLVS